MALRGLGGIDPFLFGNGIAGDISHTTDFTQLFDAVTRNWKAVKASGGDPNFTVTAPGWRIFATREIHIGGGVTLSARGTIGGTNSGGAAAGGAGATAGTMGSGTAGGSVSLNVGLTPGAGGGGVDNTRSIGGSGGAGGTAGGASSPPARSTSAAA
jgi:hypothetical protein